MLQSSLSVLHKHGAANVFVLVFILLRTWPTLMWWLSSSLFTMRCVPNMCGGPPPPGHRQPITPSLFSACVRVSSLCVQASLIVFPS